MKRVVQIVVGSVLATALVIVVMGLILPRDYRAEKSVLINAPSATIHGFVANFRHWPEWAAWEKKDPSLKYEYSGAATGQGAVQSWTGKKTGYGTLTITRANPEQGVWFEERIESKEVTGHGAITYAPEGGATRVTWKDEGTLPPIIGGFFRSYMKDELEEHFRVGLSKLKTLAEAARKPDPSALAAPNASK